MIFNGNYARFIVAFLILLVIVSAPEVYADKNVEFELIVKGNLPEMGNQEVRVLGRVEWTNNEDNMKSGTVTFGEFKYSGSIKFSEQNRFSCAFEQKDSGQLAMLVTDEVISECDADLNESIKVGQRYAYAYTVLESMLIVSSVKFNRVEYLKTVTITSKKYQQKCKDMGLGYRLPEKFSSYEEGQAGRVSLRNLDLSRPMLEYSELVIDSDGIAVSAINYSVDKKYYSDKSLELSNRAACFNLSIPKDMKYYYYYSMIKRIDIKTD